MLAKFGKGLKVHPKYGPLIILIIKAWNLNSIYNGLQNMDRIKMVR